MSSENSGTKKRVVVVGSGATGLATIYTLQKYGGEKLDIHLVEANDHIGGHAWTITSPTVEKIDVGFMVMNKETYPNIIRIFKDLNVSLEDSDMSFAVFNEEQKISWSFQSSNRWLIRNLVKPRFWKFLGAHTKFCEKARNFLQNSHEHLHHTVADFCSGLDDDFCNNWLIPFVSAVWSVGVGESERFSIIPLLRFLDNHRFLTLGTVPWLTPKFRSEQYVKNIMDYCKQVTVHLSTKAVSIDSERHVLLTEDNQEFFYDYLVLACSAPIQASLNPPAKQWLSNFQVARSRIVAHQSPYGMPSDLNDWSSWNVQNETEKKEQASVTYWLSKIQNLRDQQIFISVNPSETPKLTFFDQQMEHPVMNLQAYEGQKNESQYQGKQGVFYAGAWLRHGFHEDGFFSGILAARRVLNDSSIPIEYPTGSKGIIEPTPIKGITTHIRYEPTTRSFEYPLYLFRWDLRNPPSRFSRKDFFGNINVPLDTAVRTELLNRLGIWPLGKIEAVGNLRYFGLTFNPITPYYAYNESDQLIAILCEVHNTPWGEKCLYAMKVNENRELEPSVHQKIMHVSPFNPPPSQTTDSDSIQSTSDSNRDSKTTAQQISDWSYKFTLSKETDSLVVETQKNQTKVMKSTLEIEKPNNNPQSTHKVLSGSWRTVFWIYYQAFLIICFESKKLPMYSYNSAAQTPFTSPIVWTMILFIYSSMIHLYTGNLITSFMVLGFSICFTLFRLSSNSNLIPLIISLLFFFPGICLLGLQLFSIESITSEIFVLSMMFGSFFIFPESETYEHTQLFNSWIQVCCASIVIGFVQTLSWWIWLVILGIGFINCFPSFYNELLLKFEKLWISTEPQRQLISLNLIRFVLESITEKNIVIQSEIDSSLTSSETSKESANKPTIIIHHPINFLFGILNGDLGIGESYVNGDWSAKSKSQADIDLYEIIYIFASHYDSPIIKRLEYLQYLLPTYWLRRWSFMEQFGSLDRKSSAKSIASHYDDGNELFRSFLGPKMVYTSAIFESEDEPLEVAQQRKIDRILELAKLQPGERFLDIGSGWGALVSRGIELGYKPLGVCNCKSMISFAKQNYGEQYFREIDYRDLSDNHEFDAITCVEMIEAVPARDYHQFVTACYRSLKPGGRVSMQVINALAFNNPVARRRNPLPLGTFVTTHIFPGQQLPNLEFLHEAFLNSGKFRRVYSETNGHDYGKTLAHWARNLEQHTDKFTLYTIRKYRYYLAWCRAGFDSELLQLSRIVFEKNSS